MHVTVKLFGPAAQLVGRRELTVGLDTEPHDCAAVRARLGQLEPALAPALKHGRFAVNYEYVDDHHPVTGADEIALVAMVGGG